ncbi:MAG TPA: SDR family oxidoreductase [Pararhizobium sp.]|nr:SDR family oxidoreductase [Pararhizobium sp.]
MPGKIALVFGGSRGIGAACVEMLARDGHDVAFTYVKNQPKTREAANGRQLKAYRVDIEDGAAVERIFADVAADFGSEPSCVVANAGINVPPAPMARFDPDDFRKLVETNIVGAFNILAAAARNVSDGGTIIALTTSLVRHAAPGIGPYSATKAAVECLVRSMAKELSSRNVRVNAVAPGPVDTDLFRSGKNEEAIRRSAAMSPFNRVGEPPEIAEVVAFLASDRASWMQGQIVQPNGGLI